jgi:hypothetical protein
MNASAAKSECFRIQWDKFSIVNSKTGNLRDNALEKLSFLAFFFHFEII